MWDGLVIIGEHLHVDRIHYTTHVRPFGLLCSEAMSVHARLVNTRCIRTLESITPDHHVVLRNNEPSQRCTVRGNTFLEIIIRDHLTYYRRSKQIRCKNMINITCNQIVTWYGQYHYAPLISIFGAPWSSSSPAWHHDLHHHDLHHCVFMKSSRQRLLLLLWLTRLATK